MALVITWENDAGEVDFIEFDVVDDENHEANVEVTEFPVEDGPDVADNARPAAETLQIVGFVSLKPLPSNPGVNKLGRSQQVSLEYSTMVDKGPRLVDLQYVKDAPIPINFYGLGRELARLITPRPRTFNGSEARAAQAVHDGAQLFAFQQQFVNRCRIVAEKLEECRMKSRRLRVLTALRDYSDMLITREAEPRAADDGGGIIFQLDLKRSRTVRSKKVAAPVPAEPRGAARENKGGQAAKPDPNAEAKKEKFLSVARQIHKGVAERFK
jgi:hypothetical protein